MSDNIGALLSVDGIVRVRTNTNTPLASYEDAIVFLNTYTGHAIGQIVEVLYNVNDTSGTDSVSCVVAIGTKDARDYGITSSNYGPRATNGSYSSQEFPNGPCGAEFYEIISHGRGGGGGGSSTTTSSGIYRVTTTKTIGELTSSDITIAIQNKYGNEFTGLKDGDLCVVEIPYTKEPNTSRVSYQSAERSSRVSYITYIYTINDGIGTWKQVDVSADHVIFYDGIQRTEAWGSQAPTTLQTECKGYNLIELMEHYLVSERDPDIAATWNVRTAPIPTAKFKNDLSALVVSLSNGSITIASGTTRVVLVNPEEQQVRSYSTNWNSEVVFTGMEDIVHGPAQADGLVYGATADATHAELTGDTLTGTGTLRTTTSDNLRVHNSLFIQTSMISTHNGSTSTSEGQLALYGNDRFSVFGFHQDAGYELEDTEHVISITLSTNNSNLIRCIIKRTGGDIPGLGTSTYKTNLGNDHDFSEVRASGSALNGVHTITERTNSIQLVLPQATYKLHPVYPIRTNGTPVPIRAEKIVWTQAEINRYGKFGTEVTSHERPIDYLATNNTWIYIGFGDYRADVKTLYIPSKATLVKGQYYNVLNNSWVDSTWNGTPNIIGDAVDPHYHIWTTEYGGGSNIWRFLVTRRG